MNKEEIIKLAQEAGLIRAGENYTEPARWGISEITDFYSRAAAAEREACAALCDQMFHDWCNQAFEDEDEAYRNKPDAEDCKKAIRARGNT
jgi:hypothetical protein